MANNRRTRSGYALLATAVGAVFACACLVVVGAAAILFLPRFLSSSQLGIGQPTVSPQATVSFEPPAVIDSLPASPGGGAITDDQGVSLALAGDALEAGQSAYLERARLSDGMRQAFEAAYQVESLAYAVTLQDGHDAAGRAELVLPAPSTSARLAVLVDDRWLGILEVPVQDGVFRVSPMLSLGPGMETYEPQGGGAAQAPNRYLVVTPKTGGASVLESPPSGGLFAQAEPYGQSCVAEELTAYSCWRNTEGSVYVFWGPDFPASLQGQENARVVDTIKTVAALMAAYQAKGFTAAAISASRPAYVVVEAGAKEPYYSQKTGNVYVAWDVIGAVSDSANTCNLAHEFFHWIEDEAYIMGAAAISGPATWWLENSAENGAFLLYPHCIENNLSKYGIVNTNANVLGLQAAPAEWEWGDQARYIHAHQLYLSICEGGSGCALTEAAWINSINEGTYPLIGDKLITYMRNSRDLGRFLLGAAPENSRAAAAIPPAAVSGNRFGDYLLLQTSPQGPFDFGLTMNQFTKASAEQVKVSAKIERGGVYPLWVSNGTRTPMGVNAINTGLPGVLEILAGPAFWLKQDQAAPVFYPAGTALKFGPISNKLGIGTARIIAIAPDTAQTFQATLSLADLSGDWSTEWAALDVRPIDCPGYSEDSDQEAPGPDTLLQYFSGYGTYVKDPAQPGSANLIWQGTLPEGNTGSSEVTVETDRVTLHYHLELPKPASAGLFLSPLTRGQDQARDGALRRQPWAWLWVAVPGLGLVIGERRISRRRLGRRRLRQFGLLAVMAATAASLTSCVYVWGSIDATYSFYKIDYINPEPAEAGSTAAQPTTTWRLSNGQMLMDFDLTIATESTDANGATVLVEEPCYMTASSTATGSVGPADSVVPPE